MNYNEMLKDYDKEEYVYIIEECDGIHVSSFEPEYIECSQCGMFPTIINEGLVGELLECHNNILKKYTVGKYNINYDNVKIKKRINYRNR